MPSVFDSDHKAKRSVFEKPQRSVFDRPKAPDNQYSLDPILLRSRLDEVTGVERPQITPFTPEPTAAQKAQLRESTGRDFTGALADAGELLMTPLEIMDEGVTEFMNLPTTAQNKVEQLAGSQKAPLQPLYEAGKPVVKLAPEFTEDELNQMKPWQRKLTAYATSGARGIEALATPGNVFTAPALGVGSVAKTVGLGMLGAIGLRQPQAGRDLSKILDDPNISDFEKDVAKANVFGVQPLLGAAAGYGAARKPILETVAPKTAAIVELSRALNEAPAVRGTAPTATRQLGITLPDDILNPLAEPNAVRILDQMGPQAKARAAGVVIPEDLTVADALRREREFLDPTPRIIAEPLRKKEISREAGETTVKKNLEGVSIEPGFERTASDILLEKSTKKGGKNAIQQEATRSVFDFRQERSQGQGEVPGETGGGKIDEGGGQESLSVAPESVTLETILNDSGNDYFNRSQKWSQDSMAGKGASPQVNAEVAALRDRNVEAWKEAYRRQSESNKALLEEAKANPQAMADPAFQKKFSGAAQKAQFFSEGIKVLEGAEPLAKTKEIISRDDALRTTHEIPEPPSIKEINDVVNQFEKDFPGLPKVNIALDYHGLPDSLHQTAYRQGAHPTAIKGAFSKGEVWLNRMMLDNPADVRATLLHEAIGHMATDAKLGRRMQKFFEQTHDSLTGSDVYKDVLSRYPKANKSVLGSEMIAKLSEAADLNPTLWNKVVGKVREFLRDLGFVKKVTDNDIKVLLRSAADAMRRKAEGRSGEAQLSLKSAREIASEKYPNEVPKKPEQPVVSGGKAESKPAVTTRTLSDIEKIFEPAVKAGPTARQRVVSAIEAFRTGVSSKFRPLNRLAEDIAKSYGLSNPKDIAGIAEQLKGSSGKGEAAIYRFDREVSDLVKGSEKDFNSYMFLRRSLDRLNADMADINRAVAGEEVATLNRRSVGDYTIPELEGLLSELESKLGLEKTKQFQAAADNYQKHMDSALRLQVESGRMSPEVYDAIKSGNQFYAPFKVMKYIEESMKPEGTGKKIDTVADFTKAMRGIEEGSLKLGDMLAAGRQSLMTSRILADKNIVMREIASLASLDTEGRFIKRLKESQEAPRGMEEVSVLEDGRKVKYAVDPGVRNALDIFGSKASGPISRFLGYASVPFRAGATALNVPFQVSNILADAPRAALVSKYGVRGVRDLLVYPMDFTHALLSSISANVGGVKSKLYLDYLDSGAAGSVIQDYLTPEALKFKETRPNGVRWVADKAIRTLPEFAKAIEETSKILGIKRAKRFHGVESGEQLAKMIPEAVTEIRRFSGSPDFGRQGSAIEAGRLNLLYMFLNARIQGAIADVGRLAGRDGKVAAARTWAGLTAAVGLPSATLYFFNQRPENKDDYQARSDQEKQNYWMIPKYDESGKPKYIKGSQGEDIRDYWRIPKREVMKWISNLTESGIKFAEERDPESVKNFGKTMVEELFPVNISGDTAQERLESVASSLNPVIKTPIELASGRDLYRHRDIVGDRLKKADPELQYYDRTPELFKKAAEVMPDVAPEVLRSPLMLENLTRNLTAGLVTQFLPRKPVEGRSKIENNPLLQRFQGLSFLDDPEIDRQLKELEREAANESITLQRRAQDILDANKGRELDQFVEQAGSDPKLITKLVDMYVAEKNGVKPEERRIMALPVAQRAKFIADKLRNATSEEREKIIENYALKRVLTESVMAEVVKLLEE